MVTAKLNSKCLSKFRRDIEEREKAINKLQRARYNPDAFYSQVFLPKVGWVDLNMFMCMKIQSLGLINTCFLLKHNPFFPSD